MVFIKEESEDVKIEETFRVKHEDTEEQTDRMPLKEESQELNEIEEKEKYEERYITGEKSTKTKKTSTRKAEIKRRVEPSADVHLVIHHHQKKQDEDEAIFLFKADQDMHYLGAHRRSIEQQV
ncbi:hypothetical protein G5714_004404 [Onychostoma macrolepis]|uniref:Uncharacterized protein n=1 Tax=Onychostoma macrolepis TaxID=369639 RepID=A0A7J6D4M4_9TELE|nr:hypothetical protein G5714_004404 [Onychostoma macrolepis]